jgi:hypothetical protein
MSVISHTRVDLTFVKVIDFLSYIGKVDALQRWKDSGIPLKYTISAIALAVEKGHLDVLDWWKKSGFPVDSLWPQRALVKLLIEGHSHLLEWWKRNGLSMECECDQLIFHSKRTGDFSVFDRPLTKKKLIRTWKNAYLIA